jgi:TetR/AcrR family transcriptional repressor of nem operon
MPKDGRTTKESILDAASALVLEKGFVGTSVDDIIHRAGISRGTFFYHFPSKDDLARTLLQRHAATDKALTDRLLARAESLARDPLQQILIFFGLYMEVIESLPGSEPGCLFASFSYEAGLFDEETTGVILTALDHWRDRVGAKLDEALELHGADREVDGATLADLAYTVIEGSMIMARVRREPAIMVDHLRCYRSYLEHLFGVAVTADATS